MIKDEAINEEPLYKAVIKVDGTTNTIDTIDLFDDKDELLTMYHNTPSGNPYVKQVWDWVIKTIVDNPTWYRIVKVNTGYVIQANVDVINLDQFEYEMPHV